MPRCQPQRKRLNSEKNTRATVAQSTTPVCTGGDEVEGYLARLAYRRARRSAEFGHHNLFAFADELDGAKNQVITSPVIPVPVEEVQVHLDTNCQQNDGGSKDRDEKNEEKDELNESTKFAPQKHASSVSPAKRVRAAATSAAAAERIRVRQAHDKARALLRQVQGNLRQKSEDEADVESRSRPRNPRRVGTAPASALGTKSCAAAHDESKGSAQVDSRGLFFQFGCGDRSKDENLGLKQTFNVRSDQQVHTSALRALEQRNAARLQAKIKAASNKSRKDAARQAMNDAARRNKEESASRWETEYQERYPCYDNRIYLRSLNKVAARPHTAF